MHGLKKAFAIAVIVGLGAACAKESRTDTTAEDSAAAAAPALAPAPAPALDDAAIVGIFDAANTWDISTGSIAATKGSTKAVRDLGAMLERDHKAVQQQGRDLAAKLGVTPTPVAADFALKTNYESAKANLETLSGAAFDKAFLEYEVAYHQNVIDAINGTLMPAIQNAELKALVEKVAPAFEAHRAAAANLLAKM